MIDSERYPNEPLTYEWLLANGWHKLERGELQPTDHCRREVGLETTTDEHFMVASEDMGIEVCPDKFPEPRFWFCWLTIARAPRAPAHTWIHVRHLKTVRDLVLLYEGLTGRRLGKASWRRDELAPAVFDDEVTQC
jgi:hypothetical protein